MLLSKKTTGQRDNGENNPATHPPTPTHKERGKEGCKTGLKKREKEGERQEGEKGGKEREKAGKERARGGTLNLLGSA